MHLKALTLFLVIFSLGLSLFGQNNVDENEKISAHLLQAKKYTSISFFAEASEEFERALLVAKNANLTHIENSIKIDYAEMLRKSNQLEEGIILLNTVDLNDKNDVLYVKKLGRIAAIIHQMRWDDHSRQLDTIKSILKEAILIAEQNGYKPQLASLKNELGFLYTRNGQEDAGAELLSEASQIFFNLKDTQNYVVTLNHLIGNRLSSNPTLTELNELIELKALIEGRNWYTIEIDLYNQIANYYNVMGDELNKVIWEHEAAKSFVKYNNAIHNDQMASFKVHSENRKYQEIAEEKTRALETETQLKWILVGVLGVITIMSFLVIGLFVRERKLKSEVLMLNQDLNIANDRYEMILIESNHRIKNNLQMVISMLSFSGNDGDESVRNLLKKVTGNIRTIAALHKHIYPDVHNEKVKLETYYNEIIQTYLEITNRRFEIKKTLPPISIKSERIVYFGLILNEMLSNTIEHNKLSEIMVSLEIKQTAVGFLFSYSDGGSWDSIGSSGVGLSLIEKLVKRIGGFKYRLIEERGTYQFMFYE